VVRGYGNIDILRLTFLFTPVVSLKNYLKMSSWAYELQIGNISFEVEFKYIIKLYWAVKSYPLLYFKFSEEADIVLTMMFPYVPLLCPLILL